MKLSTITLSGANEFTDMKALLNLCEKYPLAEIGIQVSGEKAAFGMARYWWIWALSLYVTPFTKLALHLNKDWVEAFCAGKLPKELETFLSFRHDNGEPIFSRVQLNFKIGRDPKPDFMMLENMIKQHGRQRFIFSYNDANALFINNFHARNGAIFDCVYDESFGEGILPKFRKSPAFGDVLQGYAGGLSPENVAEELNKIAKVLPEKAQFYLDAEGRLKGEDGHISAEKCKAFINNALQWQKSH